MNSFNIGDEVVVTGVQDSGKDLVGHTGTVVCSKNFPSLGPMYGVDFKKNFGVTHDLHGTLKGDTGYYFFPNRIELAAIPYDPTQEPSTEDDI